MTMNNHTAIVSNTVKEPIELHHMRFTWSAGAGVWKAPHAGSATTTVDMLSLEPLASNAYVVMDDTACCTLLLCVVRYDTASFDAKSKMPSARGACQHSSISVQWECART